MLGQHHGWEPEPERREAEEDSKRQRASRCSTTDMEVYHAVLNAKPKRRSYIHLRASHAPPTASGFVDPKPLSLKLEQFKYEFRSAGRPVREYSCGRTGRSFVGLQQFGGRVLEDLLSGVLRDECYVSKES
jgi:hypothetical protein